MYASDSSIKILQPFSSWNDHFILLPPRRFVVFGEGKDGELRSTVVEGYLNEMLEEFGAFSFSSLKRNKFEKAQVGFHPERKVAFLEELTNEDALTTFSISKDEIKVIKKADGRRFTHLRFYRKSAGATTIRIFDARKYFSAGINSTDVDDFLELSIMANASTDFYFYMEFSTLKKLPLDDYTVTVLKNDVVTFEGAETGLLFHTRNQRLGENMESRIEDLGAYDEIFLLDSNRVSPTKNDWKNPRIQRR